MGPDVFTGRDILPVVATLSLGAALFVPLRDDRPGRRATTTALGAPLPTIFATAGSDDIAVSAVSADKATHRVEADESSTDAASEPLSAVDSDPRDDASFAEVLRATLERSPAPETALIGPTLASANDADAIRSPRRSLLSLARDLLMRLNRSRMPRTVDGDFDPDCGERDAEVASAKHETCRLPIEEIELAIASAAGDEHPATVDVEPATIVRDDEAPARAADDIAETPVALADDECALIVPARALPMPTERVIPLTRRRLGPTSQRTTWTSLLDPAVADLDEVERHALLAHICESAERRHVAALEQAYLEEPASLRRRVLEALIRFAQPSSAAIFAYAMKVGDDAERSNAVDGLIAIERLDELPLAFDDRCDAIAAKAAFAFAATRDRDEFARRVAPLVDPMRYEAIVTMLAGILS